MPHGLYSPHFFYYIFPGGQTRKHLPPQCNRKIDSWLFFLCDFIVVALHCSWRYIAMSVFCISFFSGSFRMYRYRYMRKLIILAKHDMRLRVCVWWCSCADECDWFVSDEWIWYRVGQMFCLSDHTQYEHGSFLSKVQRLSTLCATKCCSSLIYIHIYFVVVFFQLGFFVDYIEKDILWN